MTCVVCPTLQIIHSAMYIALEISYFALYITLEKIHCARNVLNCYCEEIHEKQGMEVIVYNMLFYRRDVQLWTNNLYYRAKHHCI